MNLIIENTPYSLLLYFLINNSNDNYKILYFGNAKFKNLKKVCFFKDISIKKDPFGYYYQVLKIHFYILYHIIKYKDVKLYGNDALTYPSFFKSDFYILEDGLVNYTVPKKYKNVRKNLKEILKLKNPFYVPYGYGKSKNIKKIYLTALAPIPKEIEDKVEVLNLKELWNKKTKEEKEIILKIFNFNDSILKKITSDTVMLFTQPLSEDKIISEEEKIELYSKILKKYNNQSIIIKPHPREITDYSKYFPDYYVMIEKYPVEILELVGINIKKAITIFSTAVFGIGKNIEIDFYGTEIHPELLKKFGSHDHLMKRNTFIDELKNN